MFAALNLNNLSSTLRKLAARLGPLTIQDCTERWTGWVKAHDAIRTDMEIFQRALATLQAASARGERLTVRLVLSPAVSFASDLPCQSSALVALALEHGHWKRVSDGWAASARYSLGRRPGNGPPSPTTGSCSKKR